MDRKISVIRSTPRILAREGELTQIVSAVTMGATPGAARALPRPGASA